MSRATDYLRSLTSHSISQVNFYKLGQIAGYIEGLEGGLAALLKDIDEETNALGDPHVVPAEILARCRAALTEPDV